MSCEFGSVNDYEFLLHQKTGINKYVGPSYCLPENACWPRRMLFRLSHGEFADGTDEQTDGHQTITLRFPLDAVSVLMKAGVKTDVQRMLRKNQ